MNPRDQFRGQGGDVAVRAFDAGVMAVLAVVYGNAPMGPCGINASAIGEEHAERIRKLRKRVNGKRAYPGTKQ
jgi:hypothetical protein